MILELLQFLFLSFLKALGFGLEGVGEFESNLDFRKKINSRIQTEKDDRLPLFDGSLQDANKVAEEVNGILLIIFLNSNCGDSKQFESSVLKDEGLCNQIKDISFKTPMIVLSDISNHYHFKDSKSFNVQQFPAIFIKTKYQDKFQTILSYEGFIDTPKVLGLIQSVLIACEAEIAHSAEISAVRALQSEQDSAYLKSLEIDKEKLRKRPSTQCESENEIVADDSKNKLTERICRALLDIEDEPPTGSTGIFRFQFQFPDGTRKIRSFDTNSTSKSLFDFIFSSGVELRNERIAIKSIEPSVELLENDSNVPLKLNEIEGIGKGIKLHIEYL